MNIKKLIEKIESNLSVKAKISIGALAGCLLAFSLYAAVKLAPTNEAQNTVMITTLAKNSGGTGVVMSSSESLSTVLTNNHVCEAVKNGGLVSGNDGEYTITSLKQSKQHDLCLVSVNGNLHASTKLSSKAPKSMDEALISGHPNLLPTIQTKGHYTGRVVIPIMIGVMPCQPGEKNPYCMAFGIKPQLRYLESVIVSATIMPGSSGSGVYNSKHELTNLVFAGHSGDGLSYAFVVPYEYLDNFLNKELSTVETKYPSYHSSDLEGDSETSKASFGDNLQHIKDVCSTQVPQDEFVKLICKVANSSTLSLPE